MRPVRSLAVYIAVLSSLVALVTVPVAADDHRPKSPPGTASTQIGDAWIDVTYSRPILRGRQGIFGAGEEYGKTVMGRSDYWRAGANATTRITTELDLQVQGNVVPAGDYAVVVGLGEDAWTLVLTTQQSMESFDREALDKGLLWGSYGYDPKHDVARATMKLTKLDHSVDQMTIGFVDVDETGATLAIWWDDTLATTRLAVPTDDKADE